MICGFCDVSTSAAIVDRKTGELKCRVPTAGSRGTWTRRRNATSTAQIVVPVNECEDCMCDIDVWCCELVFTRRQGAETETVWVGPIVGLLDDPDSDTLTITAYDRSVWWFGPESSERVVTRSGLLSGTNTPLGMFQTVVEEAEACDPTGLTYEYLDSGPQLALTLESNIGDPHRALVNRITDLGLNWTVVGSTIYVGENPVAPAANSLIRGSNWQPRPATQVDGFIIATYVVVRNTDGTIVGTAGDPCIAEGCRGVHHRTLVFDEITSTEQANQIAAIYLANHAEPQRLAVTGAGGLAATSQLCIADMIPGRLWDIATEADQCLTSRGPQTLTGLQVGFADGVETGVAPDFVAQTSPYDERAL